MELMNVLITSQYLRQIGGSGGGGSSSGEMTAPGAEIYMVAQGMCLPLSEMMGVAEGGSPDALKTIFITVVRDELPIINKTGIAADNLPTVFCVKNGDGSVHMWVREWAPFSEMIGMPEHGWVDKAELDALDYTDESNFGVYCVRAVRQPLMDGSLTDLVSNADKVSAFFGDFFMLNTVDLPNAIIIGMYAFSRCVSITSVNIPKVKTIGERAFDRCESLASITLPRSLGYIGNRAFANCYVLSEIKYDGTIDQWNSITFGEACFNGVLATEVICSDGTVALN